MTDVEQGVMTDEHQSGHFAFRTLGQNETMVFYLTLQNCHVSIYEDVLSFRLIYINFTLTLSCCSTLYL